jgi:hypothetical protein
MVTQKYLKERERWIVHPCDRCGLSDLFDAPSDLIAKVFPTLPSGGAMEKFTAFCGVCGGVQVVELVTTVSHPAQEQSPLLRDSSEK